MSAQAGVRNFDGQFVHQRSLAKITAAVEDYGPAGRDAYCTESIGIVHGAFHSTSGSRLEHQPYESLRGNVITWDGRLDNRADLIRGLCIRVANDKTDIAIVMAAYEKWGVNCFSKLIGDWALVIWDVHEKTLILGRDYIGIRRLYYYLSPRSLIWCSQLGSLVSLLKGLFHIDDEYIAWYLAMHSNPALTPFREIRSVPPGNFVQIHNGEASVRPYWEFDPRQRIRYRTDAEYEEHFRHVFRDAVRRRLRSDSPVLAELSGGLDSSSIVCMADEIIENEGAETPRLDTISYYDLSEPQGDDWKYFTKVEEKRGRTGFHIDRGKFGSSFSLDSITFAPMPGRLENPDVETERSKVIRNGNYKIVLSGMGGDEFLGGVPDPRWQLADLIVQFRPLELAKQLAKWSLVKRTPWIQLLFQVLAVLPPRSVRARIAENAEVPPWINSTFALQQRLRARQLGPQEPIGVWLPSIREAVQTLTIMSGQVNQLQPSIEDKAYPYLDQSLVEFLLEVPASQLLRPGERRSLMRRSLVNLLPREVYLRRTKATTARSPMAALEQHWGQLTDMLHSSCHAAHAGYIDQAGFLKALIEAKNGTTRNLVRLLRGLSLEIWLRSMASHGLIDVNRSVPTSAEVNLIELSA